MENATFSNKLNLFFLKFKFRFFFARQLRMTILDCCISLKMIKKNLVVLGVVDMRQLLLNSSMCSPTDLLLTLYKLMISRIYSVLFRIESLLVLMIIMEITIYQLHSSSFNCITWHSWTRDERNQSIGSNHIIFYKATKHVWANKTKQTLSYQKTFKKRPTACRVAWLPSKP